MGKIVRLRAMGMRSRCSLPALLFSLLLTLGCLGDDADDSEVAAAGRGGNAGSACAADLDCKTDCFADNDCEAILGQTCVFDIGQKRGQVLAAPPLIESRMLGKDAGQEPDSDTDAGSALPRIGHCTRYCSTRACPQGMVCSSTGACMKGCDYLRPETCAHDQFCDFAQSKCVSANGDCTSVDDCPRFDSKLMERGKGSCEDELCRYTPALGFGEAIHFSSTRAAHGEPPIAVQQPSVGQRIVDLENFTFQFDVPAQVMVLGILKRPDFKNLDDAANSALWIAYVDGEQAQAGVRLSDGGSVHGGKWLADTPFIPMETPLYFLALGYRQGQRIGRSEPIPFIVGPPLPQPGDACAGLSNGEFCSDINALICVDEVCRTPCFSDRDCAPPLRCFVPNHHGVLARVCR